MLTVNLFDKNFTHTEAILGVITSTNLTPPTKIKWVNGLSAFDGITVFTDAFLTSPVVDQVQSKLKVAWLVEPRAIYPNIYNDILRVEDKFDLILTFDAELLKRSRKYQKYIMGQTRVSDDVAHIAPKSREVSLISSGKRIAPGHRLREEVVGGLHPKHQFDLWGLQYRRFEEKIEPLQDYEFSIAIMNSKADNYFTEILIDCFRLGTVPIFWGCPNIGEFFDIRGMEVFDTVNELDYILSNLKPYGEYLTHIEENFRLCQQYTHTDDHIADILLEYA